MSQCEQEQLSQIAWEVSLEPDRNLIYSTKVGTYRTVREFGLRNHHFPSKTAIVTVLFILLVSSLFWIKMENNESGNRSERQSSCRIAEIQKATKLEIQKSSCHLKSGSSLYWSPVHHCLSCSAVSVSQSRNVSQYWKTVNLRVIFKKYQWKMFH